MKKLSFVMIAAAAVLSLQACHGNKDSKGEADSINNAKDVTKGDSLKKDTTKMAMTVESGDAKFATEAANGGMAEVMMGKLAQERGVSQKVKDFGAMMVKDHGKANDELVALAKSKNITLPAVIDADAQGHYDDLNKKTGSDFDKAYVDMMVDGHKKTQALMEDAVKNCKDPDLKAFAIKMIPAVKAHLATAEAIAKTLKK